jgi:hypothetical protein
MTKPIADMAPDELQALQAEMTPDELDAWRDRAINELHQIHLEQDRLVEREFAVVAACRALEVSWVRIGEAVGMQQPNAHRKYASALRVVPGPPGKVLVVPPAATSRTRATKN